MSEIKDSGPISTVPETKLDNQADSNNSLALVPSAETAKKPKQVRTKLDRKEMSEDEKKKETERQNAKRKILRAKEIEQSKRDILKRNKMRSDRMAIIRELCAALNVKFEKILSTNLKEELEAKAEVPEEDENLEDLNASDFDSSPSESENDERDPDETDDEVDEEERQAFKVTAWNKIKYQDSDDQRIIVRLIVNNENTSNQLSLIGDVKDTIIPMVANANSVTFSGVDASLSTVLRGLMNDAIKQNDKEREIIVEIPSKYPKKYIDIIRLYCKMYGGVRPIYKVERPMKSDPDILKSCIPIEIMYDDAKIMKLPVGRQSIEDAQIQAKYDVIFYDVIKEAGIDLWTMLEVSDYYNVIGLKELLCAIAAKPIKSIDDEVKKDNLLKMCNSLAKQFQELGGENKEKFTMAINEAMLEIEKEIAEFEKSEAEKAKSEAEKPKESASDNSDKKE